MKKYILVYLISTFCNYVFAYNYSVPKIPWKESLGNHRAVLNLQKSSASEINFDWRRHDKNPEKKRFIVIDSQSGEKVKNIKCLSVNNETCKLVVGPINRTGTYYFYYLPYQVQPGWGGYWKDYLKPENENVEWYNSLKKSSIKTAKIMEVQSRTNFDSFYPMELIAFQEEKKSLVSNINDDYFSIVETRDFPIRMRDNIPSKWINQKSRKKLDAQVCKNEYFCFQVGVWAFKNRVKNLRIKFSDLQSENSVISSENLTCFNTEGVNPYGMKFTKKLDVQKNKVQAMWIGVDVPMELEAGMYSGKLILKSDNSKDQIIQITLSVKDEVLTDRGDSKPWNHSRLRWLNSKLGIDNETTGNFNNITTTDKNVIKLSNSQIELSHFSFLPKELKVKNFNFLNNDIEFLVHTSNENQKFKSINESRNIDKGVANFTKNLVSKNLNLDLQLHLEFDSYMNYKIRLTAKDDITLDEVKLRFPLNHKYARYIKGMGLEGGYVPESHSAKWNGPHDSFWIGDHNIGLWCEFRGGSYHGPMLNLFKPKFPKAWYNNNQGRFKINKDGETVISEVYSGSRKLQKGEYLDFEFSMLVTPFKNLDTKSQFVNRYFHNSSKPEPTNEDIKAGVKVINVHHANWLNPYINYPFVATKEMKSFVDKMHQKGQKVKIYYTVRELSNYCYEIWALRSLGDEILGSGNGGGYPWLREHLVDDYRPQWYSRIDSVDCDASIVNASGDSRWYNYYVEGLQWLVNNVGIDGLYLDDVSYDRRILKRIRKVLDRNKSGCMIDLHSNTGFSKGPATQYTEFFPFIDKLWFGESFQYSKMSPENWFVEVSGIPFGLMGDMLHAGGNRWLGMLFGMTLRLPWTSEGMKANPKPIWKLWDQFGIQNSKMIGFWENEVPVSTNKKNVFVTVYKKENKVLLAIGNFTDRDETIELNIDFQKLGFDKNIRFEMPFIKDFQESGQVDIHNLNVEARKGIVLIIEN
jgi:hypothetical protein